MTNQPPIHVLVVEDELFSRLHAIDLIERAGYAPVEAANATRRSQFWRQDIRIVFTDIDMPGSMDGLKLSHAIRKRWPPIELILTSGHFDNSDDELPERGRFVAKPYRDEDIVSALSHFYCLGRTTRAPATNSVGATTDQVPN